MSEQFCKSTDSIVESLIQMFKHQNKLETVDLLEKSQARIEHTDYDNWNGGTYIFTLFLEIPLRLFAHLESRIDQFEKSISGKLSSILRDTGDQRLNRVLISPALANPEANRTVSKLTEDDINRIWQPHCFRLFLSHSSNHKSAISSLKDELNIYGISGFVAHEDIEPTKEWENEILIAINSAHALASFLTPDFHKSKWTDQEVGIALGHGLLVIPVSLGVDPYGFMASKQAMRGIIEKSDQLVIDLIDVLLKHTNTAKPMCEALVTSFEEAGLFINARKVSQMIVKVNTFTQKQLSRIHQACQNNSQIAGSWGVPERIENYLNEHGFNVEE